MRCSVVLGGAVPLVLSAALLLISCGGKLDLSFVGAPDMTGTGGEGAVSASCGDRVVDAAEDCDDGARADGDGCDGSCKVEDGWTCTGEPSVCVKCGNGDLEEGEDCDDGNGEPGDGCSDQCKIEGSCETPTPIALEADKDGLLGTGSGSTSASDVSQVPLAACGAGMGGGGADRIFSFVLPGPADLEVTVGANFDAIVRITSSACDLKSQLPNGCVDGAAVSGEEHVQLDNAAAGTYYVVVDGKTAKQAGDFSVNVSARCPLSGLKIDRVILAEPFRTTILNTNQECAVDLSRVGIYAQPEASDAPKTLPAISLEPLKRRLLTSESPPPANTTYQGGIKFDTEAYAGALYLCRGECDTANGENVIDAFRWEGEAGALSVDPPKAVAFDVDAPALTDRVTMSYYRVLSDSVFPNFSGDDFVGGYFVETFEDGTLAGWDAPTALFYKPKFEKVAGTVGAFSLSLIGGNANAAVWNGPIHAFTDNAGTKTRIAPTHVSLRVRGSDKTLSNGWAFFGRAGNEVSGFGSFFRENGTLGFGAPTPAAAVPYAVETWYLVEYKDFTYTRDGGTVGVYVDGKAKGTLTMTAPDVAQLSLRNTAKDTNFWIDQIIVQ